MASKLLAVIYFLNNLTGSSGQTRKQCRPGSAEPFSLHLKESAPQIFSLDYQLIKEGIVSIKPAEIEEF